MDGMGFQQVDNPWAAMKQKQDQDEYKSFLLQKQQQDMLMQMVKDRRAQETAANRDQLNQDKLDLQIQSSNRKNFEPIENMVAGSIKGYNDYDARQYKKLEDLNKEINDLTGSLKSGNASPGFQMRYRAAGDFLNVLRTQKLQDILRQSSPQAAYAIAIDKNNLGHTPLDQQVIYNMINEMFAAKQKAGNNWNDQQADQLWTELGRRNLSGLADSDEGMSEAKKRIADLKKQSEMMNWLINNRDKPYVDPATGQTIGQPIMSQKSFINSQLNPFIKMTGLSDILSQGHSTQQGGRRRSMRDYVVSDQALIGTLGDGTPIKINPSSFGGTVKTEDGRTIVVPAKGASMMDIMMIEKLNTQGKKFLDRPFIEDVRPREATPQPALPQEAARGGEYMRNQINQKKQQEAQQQFQVADESYKKEFKSAATGLARMIADFRQNPMNKGQRDPERGFGNNYNDFLELLHGVSEDLYAKYPQSAKSPEAVYANMVSLLQQQQGKLVAPLSESHSTMQGISRINDLWNDFTTQPETAGNPWVTGPWMVPPPTATGYRGLKSWVTSRHQKQQG